MGSAIQMSESSTSTAEASDVPVGAQIIPLPFREARAKIARTESKCKMLRESIATVQRTLRLFESIVEKIDDCDTREKLQRQMNSMNEFLLLRIDQLSRIDHLLQVTLRRTQVPRCRR